MLYPKRTKKLWELINFGEKGYIFIIHIRNFSVVADWKTNSVLEYFRYMGILQSTITIAFLLISTMLFTE